MPAEPTEKLRILHWNIHSWGDEAREPNHEAVLHLLRETIPDVVSLVEVDEAWGTPTSLAELARRAEYAWIFVPSFEFGYDARPGGFGNALLTRVPVLAVQQWQLLSPRLYERSEPSEPRSVVLAKLRCGPASVWVGSTHLPRSGVRDRTNALQRLMTLAQDLDDQWIVCGDFNTPASSWIDDARSSLNACPEPGTPTHPAHDPVEAIDYCIASLGISMEGKVLSVRGSDHLPVLVTASVPSR